MTVLKLTYKDLLFLISILDYAEHKIEEEDDTNLDSLCCRNFKENLIEFGLKS